MTTSYEYTQADFTSATNINIDAISDQVGALAITSATYQNIITYYNSPSDFGMTVYYSTALSGPDQTTLTTFINNYTYDAFADKTANISDTKTSGTNGGDFTKNTWTTRTLNTIVGDQNFCTLSGNQIILQPGSYNITASAPAVNVNGHQIRLYDITNSATITLGTSGFSTGGVSNYSNLATTLTISATTTYELQHICALTCLGIGLGRATGFATSEVYSLVSITKIS